VKIEGNYAYMAATSNATGNSTGGGLFIVNISTGALVSRTSVETVGSSIDKLRTINLKTINGTLYSL
jgi:hypothetical protein